MSHIAHFKEGGSQSLREHLMDVASLARGNAEKIDLSSAGELLGILHDFGKYSDEFQRYLESAAGLLNQDEDEDFVDAAKMRGRIDHSSAGAQLIWRELSKQGELGKLVGQILALCIASHHSGLIDCLAADGHDAFSARMNKSSQRTHFDEVIAEADQAILDRALALLAAPAIIKDIQNCLTGIVKNAPSIGQAIIVQQHFGLLVRFLFSCLIDADRVNSADFEKPKAARNRMNGRYEDWRKLVDRLETHLSSLTPRQPIDNLRNDISRHCLAGASRKPGIFTLTVPTGGGKTLASLRFALHHAAEHKMDRVIYVIPFTSIIDQNADAVRRILEPTAAPESKGRIVLEHHGNLTPEQQGWKEKMLTENWDAPVVYTTTVQLLEALFGAGTRGARRMHQLAKAVIVFDEIQTLPINCIHLFNNAIHFLTEQCGSTVVLCTATQPLLDAVAPKKGAIRIPEGNELMPDVGGLFRQLKRVDVKNCRKAGGWTNDEIAGLALQETVRTGSCLVIVNTKASAQKLYQLCMRAAGVPVFHLSTSMCPAHRKQILRIIRHRLAREKQVLCISTQLIEAGVDVDFGAVIRFAAGLDSIAQAAGRCNRNGRRKTGTVHVINPQDENLARLPDICIGRDKAEGVLQDFEDDPSKFGDDRIGPEAMKRYYRTYFFARSDQMDYPVTDIEVGHSDTLLNLLSDNSLAKGVFARRNPGLPQLHLRQSFMTAAKAFKAIDAPTRGVVVPYSRAGRELVNDLGAAFEVEKQYKLLKRAQQYTVNVFPHVLEKLQKAGAVHSIQEGTDILHLDPRYYSPEYGLVTEPVGTMETYYCD